MDLTLNIKVEQDDDARRRLNDVEKAVKGVEDAGKGTETQTVLLAKALSGQSAEAEKVTKSSAALTAQSQQLTGAMGGMTAATGLSATALAAWTAGAFALVAGATAVVGVLGVSAKHFFEHSAAMKDNHKALADLEKGWDKFQMTVGGAIVGEDFSIVRPVKALNFALSLSGSIIAANINNTKEWFSLLGQLNSALPAFLRSDSLALLGSLFRGALPVAPNTMSGQGLEMWQNFVPGATGYAFQTNTPGSTGADSAMQMFEEAQRDLAKAAKEAARTAKMIREFWEGVSPGVDIGLSGTLPGFTGVSPDVSRWLSIVAGMPTFQTGAFVGQHINVGMAGGGIYGPPTSLPGATGIGPGAISQPFWHTGFGSSGQVGGNLANVILQAIMGGGSITRGLGSFAGAGIGSSIATALTSGGGIAIGGLAGGALNALLPGIGALLGPALSGLFGKLFGPTDYELRVRQLNEDRQSANQMLATPGLERQWNMLGGNMPFNFAYLQGQAFHDPTAVQGHLDAMLEKTQRLNDAMQRYGISWEDLGEQAKQAHIDTMAEQLILDFEILTKAGADVDFVIEKMGDSVNDFIQSAVRTGSEVPLAMKPLIDRMIELGLLTDESGEAFESAEEAGVTYAKTMTQNFQDLTEAIKHLARALGHDIPDAIDKIPRDVDIDINYRENGRTGGGGGGRDDGGGRDEVPPEAFRGNRGAIVVPAPKLGTVVVDLRGSVIANDAAMDAFVTKIDRALMQRAGAFTRLRTH
jgi:hypothetical protein